MKRKKVFFVIAVLLMSTLLSYKYLRGSRHRDLNAIHVSGNIEITDAELSFKIPGQVVERLVSEGETVRAGQIVARLDSSQLAQEVAVHKAEVQGAEAVLRELEAGSRPEEIQEAEALYQKAQAVLDELLAGSRPQDIEAAKASKSSAKAKFDRWKLELERQKRLYEQDITSTQEFEKTKASYQTAYETLRGAEEHLSLVIEGPRKQRIDQAREAVSQAKAALGLPETHFGYATLYSPLSGFALSQNVEAGEYVAPGTPIITVGDLKDVWLSTLVHKYGNVFSHLRREPI